MGNRQQPTIIFESQTVNSLWQWQSWQDLPYLTCSLLQDWQHGFFTQQFWPRSPAELVQIWQPDASVYRVKQVHGNQVLTPTEIETGIVGEGEAKIFPPGDGILTDGTRQAIWVASADCTPVLIGDLHKGTVAAIHAGWRGTAQGIVPQAIARFVEGGSSLANLRIAMGPAIAGAVYQVSEEVAVQVGATIVPSQNNNPSKAILAALEELSHSPLLPDPEPGKVRLDVRRVNALQLEQLGIDPEQMAIAPYCTYQQPEYFFSYRRTNEKKVQWSGIVSFDGNL